MSLPAANATEGRRPTARRRARVRQAVGASGHGARLPRAVGRTGRRRSRDRHKRSGRTSGRLRGTGEDGGDAAKQQHQHARPQHNASGQPTETPRSVPGLDALHTFLLRKSIMQATVRPQDHPNYPNTGILVYARKWVYDGQASAMPPATSARTRA